MIELSYPEIAIGTILFTALGAILNDAIRHLLAGSRDKTNRHLAIFNKAATEFTKEFDIILDKLREPVPTGTDFFTEPEMVYEILISSFVAQRNAVAKFRRVLSDKELVRFTESWEQYYYPTENQNLSNEELDFYFFSSYISQSVEEEKIKRMRAFQHIDSLLSFAKQK